MEMCNAYQGAPCMPSCCVRACEFEWQWQIDRRLLYAAELTDPVEQRLRFALQQQDRLSGDDEAPVPDADFCEALEYALPPTVGWGMGVDRTLMLLTGTRHIRDVLAFPLAAAVHGVVESAP